ncbi:hypothetical protein M8542_15320 [Amycolatopsis sp. OK19-0408]|uniref:Uncharacterized protein n=1 Tax=Amycolatopsis iheyensis TaxID=2945988 RepID=A0A9X2NBK1_9PSEU|nr:hypothetical protein [Amycolatopsis iheyensis]MCR6484191.1 hypothetical protein [Amycolatopsis iheyensis]
MKLTAYWERQLDKLDSWEEQKSRQLPGWRDRKHRRTLAGVLAGADVVLIGSATIFTKVDTWVYFGLWAGSLLAGGAAFFLLRVLTGRMTAGFSRLLDEREREWRHRVTYVGYQVLSYLMVAALIYLLLVSHTEEGGARGAMMLSALLITGTTVPSIILGWALPDDDPEDFEEGMGND